MFTTKRYRDIISIATPGKEYLSRSLTNRIENMNARVDKNKLIKAKNVLYWKSIGKYPMNLDTASLVVSEV